ncbi:response regulator [Panacibacter sp. DH6]|uniref:Response regulator n=1 Tax=Panacibacter microcysteis TaxID=2793269 RepID=A0A931GYK0_9BACT|nr:response regulator [Panacibacter microcysteis]MBG9376407.1 response regulator [Panacibacter microcysteis]
MIKKKIYVADDDPDILEVLTIILEGRGYEVITSPDGRSLTGITQLPDLIFLDIRMSGSDGSEICRSLKNNTTTSAIPVILISANRNLQEIGESCGADAVIPKPFDIKDIVNAAGKYTTASMQ